MNSIDNLNKFMRDIKRSNLIYWGSYTKLLTSWNGGVPGRLFKLRLLDSYDYILIEKPGTGNHYPYTPEQISEAISVCNNEEKIIDDEWFL